MTLHEQAGTYCTKLSPGSAVYPPVYCAVFRVDLAAQRPLRPKSHNSPTAWPCALVRVHTGRAMARPLSSQQVRAGRSSFGADSADSAARASVDSGEPGTGALSMRAACVSLKSRHVLTVSGGRALFLGQMPAASQAPSGCRNSELDSARKLAPIELFFCGKHNLSIKKHP